MGCGSFVLRESNAVDDRILVWCTNNLADNDEILIHLEAQLEWQFHKMGPHRRGAW